MRGLLLLGIVGAAIYAVLFFSYDVLTDGKRENTYARQTQPDHPDTKRLSSWDGYLPNPSISQNPQSAMSQPAPSSPQQRNAERQPFAASEPTSSESNSSEPESVAWAKIVLAAQLHSEASVTSRTVRFYGPGTELQVVGREGAWFQVSDPVTKERGWVLDEYLSSISGPSPVQVAMETPTEQPTVIKPGIQKSSKKPGIQKSSKRSRSAKAAASRRSFVIANADPWNDRWTRRAERRRGFGLFMFRPVPRFAQGR
jgi:hypothetical protein